jgi:hypothetical protein
LRLARLGLLGGLLWLAAACATLRGRPAPWALPPVADAPFRGRWVQMLELERGGKRLPLLAVLEADGQKMVLVGLSPSGQRLLRITWTGQQVAADQDPSVPVKIEAEPILRDVVLANWPEAALKSALAGSPWTVDFDGPRRTLRRGDAIWVTVAPEPGAGDEAVLVDHKVEGYRVHVHTVERSEP